MSGKTFEDKVKKELAHSQSVEEKQYSRLSRYLRDMGKKLQARLGEDSGPLFSHKNLAARLNISLSKYNKLIYDQKRLTRDWVMAICAAHGMNQYETSKALVICGMASLDDSELPREIEIAEFLRKLNGSPAGVKELSDFLNSKGQKDLEFLQQPCRKKETKTDTVTNVEDKPISMRSPYREISQRWMRDYDGTYGSPEDDLCTKYLPRIECEAAVLVKNDHPITYLLKASSNGCFYIQRENMWAPKEFDWDHIPDIFKPILSELMSLAKAQKQKRDDLINDTRNYKGRYAANILEDQLHVFYEEYNYEIPYRNEYFMMEYKNHQYIFSVAKKSMFMQEYLTPEQYFEYYHTNEQIQRIATFTSEEEIENSFENRVKFSTEEMIYESWKAAYRRTQKLVGEKLEKLQRQEITIRDPLWLEAEVDPWTLVCNMGAKKYFANELDEYGEPYLSGKTAIIEQEGGGKIQVSLDDLEEAFVLGLSSINDICRLKQKYGTIKGVLYT